MTPGDLGLYDQAYVNHQAPRVYRWLRRWFRVEVEGTQHVPDRPFVGVGNHSGGVLIPDTLSWVADYHTSNRRVPLLTLATRNMFWAYPRRLALSLAKLGAVRADGLLAVEALRRGNAVQVYPGGDEDACRSFRRRNEIVFANRKAYVKLARHAGVPIVPVVSIGAHEALAVLWDGCRLARWLGLDRKFHLNAFPLSLCLPWGLWLGPHPGYVPLPTKIVIRVLPPIDAGADVDAVDAHVRGRMQSALNEMARSRRFPIIG